MKGKKGQLQVHSVRPRIRVYHREEIAMGPGKAELLLAIKKNGNLRQAAKELNLSYMRAWSQVQAMNHYFKKPLIVLSRGGTEKGCTSLTEFGELVLNLYVRMDKAALRSIHSTWNQFQGHLRD
jgi:molybdate transport system regulatory protein